MLGMDVCLYSYFQWCGYFRGPCVSFVLTDEFSVRVTKITSRIGVSWTQSLFMFFTYFLTQWVMAILSKGCKPDNFESHNSLKFVLKTFLAFIRILLNVNLSLNQTLLTFRLYVRQTWMITLIIFLQSEKIMHGLAVYVKNGLISRKLCGFLCFRLALLHPVSYLFFFYQSPSSLLCTVFDAISYNIDEVLSINSSTNVVVFGDF